MPGRSIGCWTKRSKSGLAGDPMAGAGSSVSRVIAGTRRIRRSKGLRSVLLLFPCASIGRSKERSFELERRQLATSLRGALLRSVSFQQYSLDCYGTDIGIVGLRLQRLVRPRSLPAGVAGTTRTYTFKAFISYSHAADGKLAPSLQHALHSFARPFYRLRAI